MLIKLCILIFFGCVCVWSSVITEVADVHKNYEVQLPSSVLVPDVIHDIARQFPQNDVAVISVEGRLLVGLFNPNNPAELVVWSPFYVRQERGDEEEGSFNLDPITAGFIPDQPEVPSDPEISAVADNPYVPFTPAAPLPPSTKNPGFSETPEPGTMALILAGVAGILAVRMKRHSKANAN
jgi:hypothetical protein